jgi:16S rRNA (adenine1518-N6/adenine1519-N6)-dimethyltransferase
MHFESDLRDFKPKRRFGQHFLINNDLKKKLILYASLKNNDIVLEVGPGNGDLTSLIAETARKVFAVERDPRLVRLLKERFNTQDKVEVIEGNVLKCHLPSFNKIVSNLPYYISSKFMLLLTQMKFELGVFTLQKEFVQRLLAKNGTRDYGRITVAVQHKMNVNALDPVPKQSFYPRPKVDSIIVTVNPKHHAHDLRDESLFYELVRELFTQRRRRIRKVLAHYLESKIGIFDANIIEKLIPVNSRVCDMTVEEFEELSNNLSSILNERALSQAALPSICS